VLNLRWSRKYNCLVCRSSINMKKLSLFRSVIMIIIWSDYCKRRMNKIIILEENILITSVSFWDRFLGICIHSIAGDSSFFSTDQQQEMFPPLATQYKSGIYILSWWLVIYFPEMFFYTLTRESFFHYFKKMLLFG